VNARNWPTRASCPTGYICPASRKTAEMTGCGRWYPRDPAGTDAWWFRCECGEMAGPALASEVAARQLGFEGVA
jgi:hypothetical protein